MYTSKNLEDVLKKIILYNDRLEVILTNLATNINERFVDKITIEDCDDYNYILQLMEDLQPQISLNDIYENENNEFSKEVLNTYKEKYDKYLELINAISSLWDDIISYVNNYYITLNDNLHEIYEIYFVDEDYQNYILKTATNYFILNNVNLPKVDDPDVIIEYLASINDYKINKFINELNNEIVKINEKMERQNKRLTGSKNPVLQIWNKLKK